MHESTGVTLPNESHDYRAARESLVQQEAKLRALTESVAKMRRALPVGGALGQDYEFQERPGGGGASDTDNEVRFSELFVGELNTLVIYSLMYGPDDNTPCPMCTAFLDGLNGDARHLKQRVNLVVTAAAPATKLRVWADERGWSRLRLLSTGGTTYNEDYRAQNDRGGQLPVLNVFSRRAGQIHHRYLTELLFQPSPPDSDPRHVDAAWGLWNLLDFTPEGRGGWYPANTYDGASR
ncbi:MAG: DUF899 family protein [Nannocystaceae bacterium]|nr:DUF899 family protein [Nannocystaceae bacterium]